MGENDGAEILPVWAWHGIELYDFGGDHSLVVGPRFRIMWGDQWRWDCIFNRTVWQVEAGLLMLVWFWDTE